MADLRNYKEELKEAVKREREADKNWSWSLKAVTKTSAKIGWGYLDYIGENELFTLEITEDEDLNTVCGTLPNGQKIYSFIGETRWDDAKTFEEGVKIMVHAMARSAHFTY